jgi:kinesin family protein 2/24
MASTYFEHIDFYHKLVTPYLEAAERSQDCKLNPILANDASDTAICARIRPLSEEEKKAQHIPGIVPKESAKAILFEPRKKFNGTPDATVSFSTQI